MKERLDYLCEYALTLFKEHGLIGWKFRITRDIDCLGLCNYQRKAISVHWALAVFGGEDVKDTILHELAHAIVGPGHDHDPVWEKACALVGAVPDAFSSISHLPDELQRELFDYEIVYRGPDGTFVHTSKFAKQYRKHLPNMALAGIPESAGSVYYIKTVKSRLWNGRDIVVQYNQ